MKFTENTLKRAARTFFQAVVAYLIIALRSGVDIYDKEAVKGLIAGLIAAGISALMNLGKPRSAAKGRRFFTIIKTIIRAFLIQSPTVRTKLLKRAVAAL